MPEGRPIQKETIGVILDMIADTEQTSCIADVQPPRAGQNIASAKRAILEAQRITGTVYGDVTAYATQYGIKQRELRTALKARGREVRSKRGRPPNIQESQSHFLVREVDSRACRSRSMPKIAVAAAIGAIAANNSTHAAGRLATILE